MFMSNKDGCYSEDACQFETGSVSDYSDNELALDPFDLSATTRPTRDILFDVMKTCNDDAEKKEVVWDFQAGNMDSRAFEQLINVIAQTKSKASQESEAYIRTYKAVNLLMTGSSSMVYIARSVEGGKSGYYAMKIIPEFTNEIKKSLFRNECEHLSKLRDIPGIIKMKDYFYDGNCGFIITELGLHDLYSTHTSMYDTSWIIRSLLTTVKSLHERGIAHCDIKPENVVIVEEEETKEEGATESKEEEEEEEEEGEETDSGTSEDSVKNQKYFTVKLIDFGNAVYVDRNYEENEEVEEALEGFVGTLNYMSPERYAPRHPWHAWSGDVWSIGVVAYELLFQQPLFGNHEDVETLRKQIIQGKWCFPSTPIATGQADASPRPDHIQNDCFFIAAKHFIRHLLVLDPSQRTSAAHALKHPWLSCCTRAIDDTAELFRTIHCWEKDLATYA